MDAGYHDRRLNKGVIDPSRRTLGYFRDRFGLRPEDNPGSLDCARNTMAIPLHNRMSADDYAHVAASLYDGGTPRGNLVRSVLENGAAQMTRFIAMEPVGTTKVRNFARFMAGIGDLEIRGHVNPYPWMQLLTFGDILGRKMFHTPGAVTGNWTDFGNRGVE